MADRVGKFPPELLPQNEPHQVLLSLLIAVIQINTRAFVQILLVNFFNLSQL